MSSTTFYYTSSSGDGGGKDWTTTTTTTTRKRGGSGTDSTTTARSLQNGGSGDFNATIGAPTTRYSQGWRSREQDRQALTPAARAAQQSYQDIQKQCLEKGVLFEDPEFPAKNSSVYYGYDPGAPFQWKRPQEIENNPRMFVGGASRFDVKQGELGNCWFLAAVGSLCSAKNTQLLNKVVPKDNSFVDNYAGVFHFQIWQYGEWVDVVIDDRLPTVNGRLMFMHSATNNEFWSALLEKAYAKLHGSYEALSGGSSSEAMVDFTGGICEAFDFRKDLPKNMFSIMKKAFDRDSLMGCTIEADGGQIEAVLANGLVTGHAYSVTGVKQFDMNGNSAKLVRVRNPWGNEHEWKGAWSDGSSEWKAVGDSRRAELGITFDDDGEFWMAFDDFVSQYNRLEICNLDPDALEYDTRRQWETSTQDGSWKPRVNAGGCRNYLDTFWTNPQYRVDVVDPDEHDDDDMGTLVIGVLQKERRKRQHEGIGLLTIGYSVYQLKDPNCGPLDLEYFKYNRATTRSSTFCNMREICGRHKLAPGHYCVIPCTFQPHQEGDFLLRLFSERPNKAQELDEPTRLLSQDESLTDKPETGVPGALPERRRRRAQMLTKDDVDDEKKAREIFKKKAGDNLELDAYALREVLDEQFSEMKLRPRFRFDGFSLETCRSLVAMMDIDHSGKLGYSEFKSLWANLRTWKKVFKEFDADDNGTFNSYELRLALNAAGFTVSNSTFNCLVMRFSGPQGKIYFDDFVLCSARLKTMFATYKDVAGTGSCAPFTADQFIQTTMYS